MSSPNDATGYNGSVVIREGTRVILREITGNLHNSPPAQSPRRKSGNEAATIKGEQQHDVKVRFIREFADAEVSGREANTESSLSSASSFQSLTSTLSSKCSSGICVDINPAKALDTSYVSAEISGLDDLISACEKIRLTDKTLDCSQDQSFNLQVDGEETFRSAVDKNSLDRSGEIFEANSPVNFPPDVAQELDSTRTVDRDIETSTANVYFECATVDSVEASRYHQANSDLGSVGETFVQCVSNLAQFDPALDRNSCDNLGVVEVAKTDGIHENVEIVVNSNKADNLQIHDINNDENSTPSLDEFTGNSTATLESLSNLIADDVAVQSKEIESAGSARQSEVAEKPTQSVLDDSVDIPSDSKQFENIQPTRRSEGAENTVKSVSDETTHYSSDLKQFEKTEPTQRSEIAENPAQSISDVIVDSLSDLKTLENAQPVQQSEVAEKPVQSVLDSTVDFPDDLKEIASVETERKNEVSENPTQSVLDVTVDFPTDLKEIESTETARRSEVAEQPTQSVLDVTVDFPTNLKEIESAAALELSEVVEKPAQSTLDVTVDIPSSIQEIGDTQPSDFEVHEPIQQKSLADRVVDDSSTVDNHECYKPLTPSLSELSHNSQCPSLPTLSSICLRAPLAESDVLLGEQPVENVQSTENTILTTAASTLSEKFANIAAIDIPCGNSIATIQEPTFFNAQKFVEESIEFTDHLSTVETEAAKLSNDNIDKTVDRDFKTAENIEKLIKPVASEVCNFKKPLLPVQTAKTKSLSPEPPKKEDKENKIQSVHSVEVEKHNISEIVEAYGADSLTDSEDLNDTVAIQDITAENIFAVAESDQYAEFLPQQQSTALALEKPTVISHKSGSVASAGLISGDNLVLKPISCPDEYAAFVPQQQSTTLTGFTDKPLSKLERQPTPFVTAPSPTIDAVFTSLRNKTSKPTLAIDDRCDFEKLNLAAKAVANDIYNTSLEIEDDNSAAFISATSELFHDARSFDFLLSKTPRKNTHRDLRAESLYVKFDPLVSNTSMLPQGNIQNKSPPINAERNGVNNTTISNIGTPKRNPAIAAIDRLLFFSPMTTTTTPTTNVADIQKANDSQEKVEPTEETSAVTVDMAKELELVRSTVIQLEEQLEKLKIDHEKVLEKQSIYQEKINQLQTQLAQEIKNKNQITVVVDEYEKSISRLVSEKERDRKNLDVERTKLQEELAAAKRHLENSEAAFNDVHQKYERLKAVAAAYKSNEIILKQSAQENIEIIKSLEIRNAQVKEYSTAQLEKANQDLDAMLKKHESETVRLNAMVRKAELKSNSMAELVEQKTKENKELTGILDEVIARVGRTKSDEGRNFHSESS